MLNVWRNVRSKWKAMLKDRRGNVAMIFGLTVIPLLLAGGVAVDYSRALIVRQRLSTALDAAALAVGRSTGLSQTQMDDLAQSYFDANYPTEALGTPTPVTVTLVGDVVTVTGHASVPTEIMRVVGFDIMNVNVQSQVTKENTGLDLVLVLDTTGSMSNNSKIDTLKTAATNLINTLFGSSEFPEFLKIGIVPFTIGVRVDPSEFDTSWLDTTGSSTYARTNFTYTQGGSTVTNYAYALYNNSDGMVNTSWLGCLEARPNGLEETDDPPTSDDTRFVPYFAPDEPHVGEAENTHGNPDWDPASPDQGGVSSNYSNDYIEHQMTVADLSKSFTAIEAFSVLEFTDSSKNNDYLTVSSHGLSTGDGPIRIYSSSPPAPLSTSTDYWIVKSNNSRIKLATSYANAIAGTVVNITDDNKTGILNVLDATHRMSTGDGPIQVRSSNTLPGGLSANTNYWLIAMGSNRFRLATTAANATAGTGVSITSQGSGTRQINALYSSTHGLATGAGPYQLTGTLPGGLSTGTDYWITRVNNDVFQFATSSANATASLPTVVTLTSIGGTGYITISGVDPATDTITATASHGFTTGDGPFRMMSTSTLPGGVTGTAETNGVHGTTDYWVIVVDSTNVKLATSRANALAGTAVDLTSVGSGTMYLSESPGGTSLSEQTARQKDWRKYVGYSSSGAVGPNEGCDMQPITPMTNDKDLLLTRIQALNAAGNTHIPLGLSWGWRVLSADPPYTEGVPYSNDHYVKAIVLMTDGDNTMPSQSSTLNGSRYTAYGYAKQERMGSGIDTASEMATEMDSALTRTCNNIKAIQDSEGEERIKIFTIGFQISNSNTLALLQNCATTATEPEEQYYFNATDNAALTSAFAQIATQLSNLRISH